MINQRKAFTLAEVLVTLAIIGVVASLTIPALQKKHEKQQWITSYKAAYSILSQAIKMAAVNNGGSLNGLWTASSSGSDVIAQLSPYFKASKDCSGSSPCGSCFADSCDYKRLDGAAAANHKPSGGSTGSLVLLNGISIGVSSIVDHSGFCPDDLCIWMFVDTNGKKGPNASGKDLFRMVILTEAMVIKPTLWWQSSPDGLCPSDLTTGCGEYYCGDTCGIRILRGDYAEDY